MVLQELVCVLKRTSVFHFVALRFELGRVISKKVEFVTHKVEQVGKSS